jgi:hypothetical protein
MKIWFTGNTTLQCSFEKIKTETKQINLFITSIVGRMPGITSVEIMAEDIGFVKIKTNEGVLTRTNIVVSSDHSTITISSNEHYIAGKMIQVEADFKEAFHIDETGNIKYHLTHITH